MRLKRWSVRAAVLAAGALMVAACGSGSGSSTSTSGVGYGKGQPKTTITFWYMPNGAQPDQYYRDEAAAFEAAHPNITVQGTNVSWGDAFTKVLEGQIKPADGVTAACADMDKANGK